MNLSEFCQPFYAPTKAACGIRGKSSQPSIAQFFMEAALGDVAKIELIFTDDLFRKWFKGEREPKTELWGKVAEVFDETRFSRTVSSKLNEEVLDDLLRSFSIEVKDNEVADKFAFSAALTKQFGAIARGNGEAEDIVSAIYRQCLNVVDFPDYIQKSQDKYSKLKTLLYSSEERSFDEFFVCNTISMMPVRFHRLREDAYIEDVTLDKLLKVAPCVLLIGMGGIGKSMMMRHLFLASIREYSKSGKVPILVTLREFGGENRDLFNVIVDSVHRFDISFSAAHVHKLMNDGRCQILLDGLDEIKSSDLEAFQRQLDALIDRYPKSQYVMSTRRFSSFVELSRFATLYIVPFSNEQALRLIDLLEYCPEEPKLKQQFRERLVNDYFKSHAEFVTNPLLLTLMLMSYHRFSDVPEKKYLFYEQAYQTLLQRHDSDKLAYKRVFHSVTDPSDFTLVFREFCAKSYRKGDYEFGKNRFDEYFETLKAVKRLDQNMMKPDNFLFDACNSACLMYEEGQRYHFLHRSFQEYFFADYYSRQDDTTLRKLGRYLAKSEQLQYDEGSAFDMLFDLAPEKVERFIIQPYLSEIYDSGTLREQYWRFLAGGFNSWSYVLLNEKTISKYREEYRINERYPKFGNACEPSNVVLAMIMKILDMEQVVTIGGAVEAFRYDDLIVERLYGEIIRRGTNQAIVMPLMHIPKDWFADEQVMKESGIVDRLIMGDDGKPAEMGYIFNFEFANALENEDKYPALVEYWEKESIPTRSLFSRIKSYYEALIDKYAHIDEMDDDNF